MVRVWSLVLALAATSPALAGPPTSSWFGFRPRDVTVTLTSSPPGALVHLVAPDGTRSPLGVTDAPLVVTLPPGDHGFLFELKGHRPLSRLETLTGATASVCAVLEPRVTRFTVPLGWHSVTYERGPDGVTRIVPPPPPPTDRPRTTRRSAPLPRDERGLPMLPPLPPPSLATVESATRHPTTTATFDARQDILRRAVFSASWPEEGGPVTQREVHVLEVLRNVNPKKACLRLDAAMARLAAAMAKDR